MESNWKKYKKTLPKAKKIYLSLFNEPVTHQEWVDRFNKVGLINEILQDG